MIKSNKWQIGILYFILIVLALLYILPILSGIMISFIPGVDYLSGSLFPKSLNFENYVKAFQNANVPRMMINSTVTSLLIVSGQLIVSSLAAYAFVFLNFKWKEPLFFIFLMTMMVPFEATFIANFQTIKEMHLIDSYFGMALPSLASAFSTFFLRQTFKQIPNELIEASKVNGFNHWKIYKDVVMPISKQSLITLGIYQFLGAWNMYLWPLLVSSNNNVRTVQIGLRQIQSEEALTEWGVVMASAVIVALPTLIILYLSQKCLQEGLAEGAVK